MFLESKGHQVTTVQSNEAVDQVNDENFEIIFLMKTARLSD